MLIYAKATNLDEYEPNTTFIVNIPAKKKNIKTINLEAESFNLINKRANEVIIQKLI